MTAPAVRLLLDVDGVLNAFPSATDPDYRDGTANGYHISWNPRVVKWVNSLAENPAVEILWLTTWGQRANDHISPLLGLPSFKVAAEPPLRDRGWWKFPVAQGLYMADETPFVWLDDDLDGLWGRAAKDWANSLDGEGLAIGPDPRSGITPRIMDQVNRFIDHRIRVAAGVPSPRA